MNKIFKSSNSCTVHNTLMFMFNRTFFYFKVETKLEDLPGYRQDVKSLCITFWQFGLDIRTYVNLTAERLTQTTKELAKEKDANDDSIFKGYASLVVCILSHGGLETVYGIDGKAVNIKDLQLAFSAEQCPELYGKPKVFFIHKHLQHQADQTITADLVAAQHEKEPKNGDDNCAGRPTAAVHHSTKHPQSSRTPINVTPPLSDVIQLLCQGIVYSEYGTKFVQGLCFHLRCVNLAKFNSLRDIYGAYLALLQQTAKEMLTAHNCLGLNVSPLYLSTLSSNMIVGFKTVPLKDRCTQIYFYGNNSASNYQDLAKFITEKIKGIKLESTDAVG